MRNFSQWITSFFLVLSSSQGTKRPIEDDTASDFRSVRTRRTTSFHPDTSSPIPTAKQLHPDHSNRLSTRYRGILPIVPIVAPLPILPPTKVLFWDSFLQLRMLGEILPILPTHHDIFTIFVSRVPVLLLLCIYPLYWLSLYISLLGQLSIFGVSSFWFLS